MKRYILFGYDDYYPSGGWADFIKASDNIEKLKKDVKTGINIFKYGKYKYENYEIVDLKKLETVWSD